MNLPGVLEHNKFSGISLIELLIVIAIIALVGAATSPFLSNFIQRNNTDVSVDNVKGYLRKAQGYAIDKKDDQVWGVCISGTTLRLFSGSCSTPVFAEEYTIPSSISITGLNEITFSDSGEPSSVLDIAINSDIETYTIQVNGAGGFSTTSTGPNPSPGVTPTPSPIPSPTPSPIPSPSPVITTCSQYCTSLGTYSAGTCRQNPGKCNQSGETNEAGGNVYCTGGANADTCCCL